MMVGYQTDCLANVLKELGEGHVSGLAGFLVACHTKYGELGIKGKQCLWE